MCRSGNDTQVVPYIINREVSHMDKTLYNAYVSILKEELLPAMGCTEPIAVAYAAAVAARELGCVPETVEIVVSGNIIKNVKSVVVPNTGGLHGLAAAICVGVAVGVAVGLREGVGVGSAAEGMITRISPLLSKTTRVDKNPDRSLTYR